MSTQWPGDFDALARQYWANWGNAMRSDAGAGRGAAPTWQDAIQWWSQLAQGQSPDANSAVDRFNAQARDWYGQMQQVAAQFAGRDAKPADIAAEWKRAMGGMGENPFPDMFKAMQGQGAQGLEQWTAAIAPWLDAWRSESRTLLGMPTFGIGREHQERLQKLAQAQIDLQQQESAYNALMIKSAQRAYAIFEKKLAERDAPGKQLTTARALFDVWIEAAEEAYAEMALSPEFRDAYGARVNAQMRLRQSVQREVEQVSDTLGMPTRSDLDAAFRKIADLERALRTLRDQVADVRHDAQRDVPAAADDAETAGPPSTTRRPGVAKSSKAGPSTPGGGKKQPSRAGKKQPSSAGKKQPSSAGKKKPSSAKGPSR